MRSVELFHYWQWLEKSRNSGERTGLTHSVWSLKAFLPVDAVLTGKWLSPVASVATAQSLLPRQNQIWNHYHWMSSAPYARHGTIQGSVSICHGAVEATPCAVREIMTSTCLLLVASQLVFIARRVKGCSKIHFLLCSLPPCNFQDGNCQLGGTR
jgi:hypothetical protein